MRNHLPDSEKRLWQRLRAKQIGGYKFRRQYPIGKYIVDFASIKARLIVEIDGDHHGNDERERLDAVRTLALEQQGWRVIRFWSSQLMSELDWVVETIREACVDERLP